MNFTTWKMCEYSRRCSCSSFIAGPFETFSELGMHSCEPSDTPLAHAAQIAYLGVPCLGKWICGLIWRFGLVKMAAFETTNTLQLKGGVGGLANMHWGSATFATWSTSNSTWKALENSDTFQEDSGYGQDESAHITRVRFLHPALRAKLSLITSWKLFKVFNSDLGGALDGISAWLGWYFGVGGANP